MLHINFYTQVPIHSSILPRIEYCGSRINVQTIGVYGMHGRVQIKLQSTPSIRYIEPTFVVKSVPNKTIKHMSRPFQSVGSTPGHSARVSSPGITTRIPCPFSKVPENPRSENVGKFSQGHHPRKRHTHAGHPITMAITASTVSPFPNPSAEYIAGANRGNPHPANERRQATAAIAVLTLISNRMPSCCVRTHQMRRRG